MNYAIILASGSGSRAETSIPKQFVKINGKTILEYTLDLFEKNGLTNRIILVTNKEYIDFCMQFKYKKLYKIIEGGMFKHSQRDSIVCASGVATISAEAKSPAV